LRGLPISVFSQPASFSEKGSSLLGRSGAANFGSIVFAARCFDTVLRERPVRRAISRIDSFSRKCMRRMMFKSPMWITPLPPPLTAMGEGSHGSLLSGNYALTRLSSGWKSTLPLLRAAPEARIVNLSSALGSLTMNADPTSPYYSQQFIGYNASKAALNMLTIQLHEELRGTKIKVNSISPGFVKTDLTGYGTMTPEEGARLPAEYALNAKSSGGFVEPDGRSPW